MAGSAQEFSHTPRINRDGFFRTQSNFCRGGGSVFERLYPAHSRNKFPTYSKTTAAYPSSAESGCNTGMNSARNAEEPAGHARSPEPEEGERVGSVQEPSHPQDPATLYERVKRILRVGERKVKVPRIKLGSPQKAAIAVSSAKVPPASAREAPHSTAEGQSGERHPKAYKGSLTARDTAKAKKRTEAGSHALLMAKCLAGGSGKVFRITPRNPQEKRKVCAAARPIAKAHL